MTPPTPRLAELEARHTRDCTHTVEFTRAYREAHADRYYLLAMVRERDARLAEIAEEVEDNMPPRGVKTPVTAIRETLRRIYNIAKGDAA